MNLDMYHPDINHQATRERVVLEMFKKTFHIPENAFLVVDDGCIKEVRQLQGITEDGQASQYGVFQLAEIHDDPYDIWRGLNYDSMNLLYKNELQMAENELEQELESNENAPEDMEQRE